MILNTIYTVGQFNVSMLESVPTFVFLFVTRKGECRSSQKAVTENRLDQGILDVLCNTDIDSSARIELDI
jgi:hypothetical protein